MKYLEVEKYFFIFLGVISGLLLFVMLHEFSVVLKYDSFFNNSMLGYITGIVELLLIMTIGIFLSLHNLIRERRRDGEWRFNRNIFYGLFLPLFFMVVFYYMLQISEVSSKLYDLILNIDLVYSLYEGYFFIIPVITGYVFLLCFYKETLENHP
jgi:hypothetical protein